MKVLVLLAGLAAAPPDTAVVGTLADPVSLDPHRATDLVSAAVTSNVCEPLVRVTADGSRHEAALATTWATVDNRHWTFTLRPGVRFHDGTPFDAEAVVANLEDLRRHRGFAVQAERVGPLVVALTLERPNAALLATLSQAFFAIQSPRQLRARETSPLSGTGPFRLGEVRPGEVVLHANPGYWRGAPRLARVIYRRYPDEDALRGALLRREVDVTFSLGLAQADRLRSASDVVLHAQTGLNLAFLSLNNERGPLRDRRVRQAIARAIDRPALVARLLGGQGEPAHNPLPPSLWGYARRTKELVLDRTVARRLLREAGRSGGFTVSFAVADAPRPYNPTPLALAAQVAEDLSNVGIRSQMVRVPSWSDLVERVRRGDYDLAVMGWQADTTDPNDFLSALLASDSIGTTNRSRYRSAEMDGLLKQGRRERDQRGRAVAYGAAQALFQRDMPWVPLYHVAVLTAYRRALRGLVIDPTGTLRFDKTWKAA
jgi:peptide/nickel transport system substrate-binding protein